MLFRSTFSLKSVSEGFGKVSEVAGKFASKVKWLSAGAGSLLGLSAKTAIDFEDAFVGVCKTVEGTDEELEQIRKDIMKLSNQIPIATTELFELAEEAGQLGIKTEDITSFTETMAKLGTATNLSATEAGEAIATFVNVMGTLPENYERIGSVIVELGNNSKATESDIVAMAQRMSGAGATLGMTESSVLGLATALSSVGLEAEMGGTAISRVMNDFNRAASGVETKYGTLSQYAKICGMSVKEFSDTVKNNAGEAIKQFVIGLGDTNRTGKSTIQLMSDLGINEVRLTDTMLRLANASGTVEEFMTMADKEWEVNNALNAEATKKYADTASQIEIAKNKIAELADKFGKILLPSINDTLGKIGKFVDWMGSLSEGTQKTIVKVLAFTTALFPMAKGVDKVTGTISSVTKTIDKLKNSEKFVTGITKTFSLFGTVVKTVGTAIMSTLGKLGALIMAHPVIAIITAIIAGIVLLWTKCEWFRNLVIGMFEKIKEVCSTVFNVIKTVVVNVWNNIVTVTKPIFESIVSIISSVWERIKTIWQTTIQIFTNIWNKVVQIVQPIFERILEIVKGITEPIKNFFSDTWNYIVDSLKPVIDSFFNMFREGWLLVKTIWDLALPFFKAIWNGIKTVFNVVGNVIGGFFSNAWEKIKIVWDIVIPFFQTVWDGIKNIFSIVGEFFGEIFSTAWETIKIVWDLVSPYFQAIWTVIQTIFSVVTTVLGGYFSSAWIAIKGVWDVVVQYFRLVWTGISAVFSVVKTVIGGAFQVAWAVVKTVWDTVTGYFKAIFDTIAGIFSVIRNVLTGNFSEAWEGIKGIVGTWTDWFKGIWNNIANVFSKVKDFFKNTFSSAWEAIKSIFSGVGSFFSGVWSTIKSVFTGIAQKIGDTMSSVFKSAVNGLLSTAERILNVPINAINKAIDILNKVPGVSIGKVSTFQLPRMEEGGVLDKGARNIIAGENGAEAIVPLEKNTKWINKVAEQFKSSIIDTVGIDTNYLGQTTQSSVNEGYLANAVDLLERILEKPTDIYLDGNKVAESTASYDDKASGDLLEKLERGWVI